MFLGRNESQSGSLDRHGRGSVVLSLCGSAKSAPSVLCDGLGERIGTGNASSGCGLDDLAWQPICAVGALECNSPLPQLSVGNEEKKLIFAAYVHFSR